jgi:hypothetical protein
MLGCLLRRDEPELEGIVCCPGPRQARRPPRRTPAKCPFRDRAEWAKTEEARKNRSNARPAKTVRCRVIAGDRFAPIGDRRCPSSEPPSGPAGAARRTPRTGNPSVHTGTGGSPARILTALPLSRGSGARVGGARGGTSLAVVVASAVVAPEPPIGFAHETGQRGGRISDWHEDFSRLSVRAARRAWRDLTWRRLARASRARGRSH